ncbi:MAG TPA: efflux transporter periplasmic adaptor subunit [Opitutae bacterium]|nr:efflux transporter periplasmic adaptor subunit [Opitutaceae bacterium]HCR30602.1 efflux transporter periplasmic adaptor subunit [Opitutae bacterium]
MPVQKDSILTWLLKYVAPFFVLLAVVALLAFALLNRSVPEKKEPTALLPVVEVLEVNSESLKLEAKSQGTVQPRTETLLVAEVSGRIESVSNAFFAGGYFKKGDPLAEIDPVDYKANLANAKSRFAEARLAYEQEKALADQAREDWESFGRGEATDLALRKPQLERAASMMESAKAAVQIAERDLARTIVRAPYDGRIKEKYADVGQMVGARQSQLARIYSTDTAEIRLPLALDQLSYLDLPESYSNYAGSDEKPKVTLSAQYGEETHEWTGIVDRVEGAIDARTRLSYVVAQVEQPYEKSDYKDRPPLKVGLFVEASIEGRQIDSAFRIPRRALHEGDVVYAVDKENRIVIKEVSVLQKGVDTVIVTEGLSDGDLLCLTPLEYVVMGMQVELDSSLSMSDGLVSE